MDSKILEYIVAIAKEQSVSKAADQFYLSHPALSRHLRKIEQEYGTALFSRDSNGMHLTKAGIIFINDAQKILRIRNQLEEDLASIRHQQRKMIRIILDKPYYNLFIRHILPQFEKDFPDYFLEISMDNAHQIQAALLAGQADIGIFDTISPQNYQLESFTFRTQNDRIIFPADYSGSTGIQGLRQCLSEGMFFAAHPADSSYRTIIEQQLTAHHIYPAKILEGTVQGCLNQVSAGSTCCIVPEPALPVQKQPLFQVGEIFFCHYSVIAYPKGYKLNAAVQTLMKLVILEYA